MSFRALPHRFRVAAAATYLTFTSSFLLPVGAVAGDSSMEGELLVMLQGEKLEEIRRATLASGAKITHELPIISALGAQMSAAQLEQLRSQPFVERVIDDLAYEPDPELGGDEDCPMGGALHLKWQDSTASWRLFNKGSDALPLAALRASWPNELGELRALMLDGIAFGDAESLPAKNNIAVRALSGEIAPHSGTYLAMRFEHPPSAAIEAQNAITITVSAGDTCSAELVPSYDDPITDTYYPTVSGAALLQYHGVTGAGVTVAVLDSGLWEAPKALTHNTRGEPRILARYDALQGREVGLAVDESGHGTHMTSVIADSRPVTREGALKPSFRGAAPDVDLVVVKAFDSTGEAGFLDLVRGIQWVTANRDRLGIRVLNLSFASRPRWPYWDDPVNQALMRAWQAGIIVIAAAGNEGPEPMTVGSPGNLPYIITVGAITDSWTEDDRSDDYLPDFSSRGPTPTGHIKPDIVAYGGHMAGLVGPNTKLAREFPEYLMDDQSFVMTGSSQAAALVSGLAALLIQAEPDVSNDDIKCMLMSSAEPAISADGRLAYSPFLQGSGLVNVSRAITVGDRGCGNDDLALDDDIARVDRFEGPAIFAEDGSPPRLPGEDALISPNLPEKGHSESRRWGADAHLQRLTDPSQPAPIDWLGRHQADQLRMKALAEE